MGSGKSAKLDSRAERRLLSECMIFSAACGSSLGNWDHADPSLLSCETVTADSDGAVPVTFTSGQPFVSFLSFLDENLMSRFSLKRRSLPAFVPARRATRQPPRLPPRPPAATSSLLRRHRPLRLRLLAGAAAATARPATGSEAARSVSRHSKRLTQW